MKKRTPCSKVVIGDRIEGVYCLKSLYRKGDGYAATLADRTGELDAQLSSVRYQESMNDLVKGPVFVSGPVIDGLNSKALVVIKEVRKAEASEYKVSDIFNGLTDNEISVYRNHIRALQAKITDSECFALVSACLTDAVLDRLAQRPATVGFHGQYRGGALAASAIVAQMVYADIAWYKKMSPGMFNVTVNMSALLTAALLHTYGVLTYITPAEPFKKTVNGLNRGYMGMLQSLIERTIAKQGVEISDEKLSFILNILGCACSMKTSVKATGPEGTIFRKVLMAYEELDALYSSTADMQQEPGEGYYYSEKLGRAILFPVEEERSA